MSVIRSEAAFDELLLNFNIQAPHVGKLKGKGWRTMGGFAVSCGWNPEGASEAVFNEKVIAMVCGPWKPEEPEPPLAPILRQLYWECLQAVVSDTRHKHDYTLNDVPRPLHSAERSHRRNLFKGKIVAAIPDIMIEDLEPAHC